MRLCGFSDEVWSTKGREDDGLQVPGQRALILACCAGSSRRARVEVESPVGALVEHLFQGLAGGEAKDR
jgi:hypothetical protein